MVFALGAPIAEQGVQIAFQSQGERRRIDEQSLSTRPDGGRT